MYNSAIFVYSFMLDFKSHFRVQRDTFEQLAQTIGPALIERENAPNMPPVKQIAIALWIFGNQEVYRLLIKI